MFLNPDLGTYPNYTWRTFKKTSCEITEKKENDSWCWCALCNFSQSWDVKLLIVRPSTVSRAICLKIASLNNNKEQISAVTWFKPPTLTLFENASAPLFAQPSRCCYNYYASLNIKTLNPLCSSGALERTTLMVRPSTASRAICRK